MDLPNINNSITQLIGDAGPDVPASKFLFSEGSVTAYSGGTIPTGGAVFEYQRNGFSSTLRFVAGTDPASFLTAEDWLLNQGFSSVRLITLLDLEYQITAAAKSSPKLIAVRAWVNAILASFVQDPTPKSNWPPAPFTFEETTQEAFALLA